MGYILKFRVYYTTEEMRNINENIGTAMDKNMYIYLVREIKFENLDVYDGIMDVYDGTSKSIYHELYIALDNLLITNSDD